MQSLSDLIMANRKFLKLNNFFNEEKISILKYYLEKDINVFLGENVSLSLGKPTDKESLHFSSETDEENSKMIIEYNNQVYIFKGNRLGFTIQNLSDPNMYAFICYYSDTNSFVNDIHYVLDENIIHERHRVYVNENKGYEYKRSVKSKYGKIRYPICHMRLISKDDYNNDYFEIYSLNKDNENIIKKLIDTIRGYSIKSISSTPDEYLANIFKIMEQKTTNKSKMLTKTKNIAKY